MSKPFIKRLSDLLFGGPVPTTPPAAPQKPLPEILFVPVIFANGRDDDSEGLKAFMEHRPVMLDGRLIPPLDNAARIEGLSLLLSHGRIVCRRNGHVTFVRGFHFGTALFVDVPEGSARRIQRCDMGLNAPVQP